MSQCIRMSFSVPDVDVLLLRSFIKDKAPLLFVEGALHILAEHTIRVVVCGQLENINRFVDALLKTVDQNYDNLHMEPFLKNRDYRGKFRVLV